MQRYIVYVDHSAVVNRCHALLITDEQDLKQQLEQHEAAFKQIAFASKAQMKTQEKGDKGKPQLELYPLGDDWTLK